MRSPATTILSTRLMSPDVEKSFRCPTCSRLFNKKANLKVHSRLHTGEKPYKCSHPRCGRPFMWKSSVTFHEQNCPAAKKDSNGSSTNPPSPMSVASKGVQKRPKSTRSTHSSTTSSTLSSLSSTRTPTKHASSTKRRPSAAALHRSPPTTPMTPDDAHIYAPKPLTDQVRLSSRTPALPPVAPALAPPRAPPSSAATSTQASISCSVADLVTVTSVAMCSAPPQPFTGATSHVSKAQCTAPSALPLPFAPNAPPTALPAASARLAEKRVSAGGGRPPIIPGSLPKHILGFQPPKEAASGPKAPFDLRVPSSPVTCGTKPLMMFGAKMPKLPIAMELDESDDEGTAAKIVGAQDAFMMTGNPFRGFAPPVRCSPLPVSSPIVCPRVSPMPLSPLAPFSPLPPESPAAQAPSSAPLPVHTPTVRPNPNW